MIIKITINKDNDGRRLDHFLDGIYKDTPKHHLQKLIRKGNIRVNDKKTLANYRLKLNDTIKMPKPINNTENYTLTKEDLKLKDSIVFENEDFIVINKPENIPVHSGSGYKFGLIDKLETLLQEKLYLVHRLDRLTSGLMLIAKSANIQIKFSEMFKKKQITKIYQCLLSDWTHEKKMIAEFPLLRVRENFIDKNIVDPQGLACRTEFSLLSYNKNYYLFEAHLITGRMHQIRAHAKALNSPIIGDDIYGMKNDIGLMLLSHKLSFIFEDKYYEFKAPWPENKTNWLKNNKLI